MGRGPQLSGAQHDAGDGGGRSGPVLSFQCRKRGRGHLPGHRQAHPDSTAADPKWECVDIKAVRKLPRAVSLEEAKAEPRLAEMVLVNNTRLSVQPVTDAEWSVIMQLSGDQG